MMNIESFAKTLRESKNREEIATECQRYGMLCSRIDYLPDGAETVLTYSRYGYRVEITKSFGEIVGMKTNPATINTSQTN